MHGSRCEGRFVSNDNDFGMAEGKDAFGGSGKVNDTGIPSRLLLLHVP